MENIEIIISNLKTKYLDLIIYKELKLSSEKIISSHFFDDVNQKDIELTNLISLQEYYSTPKTGNVYVEEIFIGEKITNAVLIMSFNEVYGDIVVNFEKRDFITATDELQQKIKNIYQKLAELFNKYEIEEIRVGYEPASDDDMLISAINKNGVRVAEQYKDILSCINISL